MYIERRGARDPHGSFTKSQAALGMLVIYYGSFAHSHAALDPTRAPERNDWLWLEFKVHSELSYSR